MKVIIAGSRTINEITAIVKAVEESKFDVKEVVCGEAKGVDQLGKLWANLKEIPVTSFIANWTVHGKTAGFIRNQEMAEYADALIAVWDGTSKGTKDMIERATVRGLKVFIFIPPSPYPI